MLFWSENTWELQNLMVHWSLQSASQVPYSQLNCVSLQHHRHFLHLPVEDTPMRRCGLRLDDWEMCVHSKWTSVKQLTRSGEQTTPLYLRDPIEACCPA